MAIKPIETIYRDYRFRSRLEARWAVFFDALGIPWEYEKEGFDLDGTWYLPDFWLPEQNCWMEIKGAQPTEEEWRKISQLAIYTGKDSYIAWGPCAQKEKGSGIGGEQGVNIVARYSSHGRKDPPLAIQSDLFLTDMPRDLVVIIFKLFRYGITLSLSRARKEKGVGNGLYVSTDEWFSGATFEQALQDIEKQHRDLKRLFAELTKRQDELFDLIPEKLPFKRDGCTFLADGGGTITSVEWIIDFNGRVAISNDDDPLFAFTGNCDPDRIDAAYTAARQARFEHGEGNDRAPSPIVQLDPLDPHAIAQEVAMELDRQYFKDHPGETSYTRNPIENEFPAQVYESGEVLSVTVTQICEGIRARVPFQMITVDVQKHQKKISKRGGRRH